MSRKRPVCIDHQHARWSRRLVLYACALAQLACADAAPKPLVNLIEGFTVEAVVNSPLSTGGESAISDEVVPVLVPSVGLDEPISALHLDPFPALDYESFQPRRLRITAAEDEIPPAETNEELSPSWFFDAGRTLVRFLHEDLAVNQQQTFDGWIYSTSPARPIESFTLPGGVYEVTVVASGMSAFGVAPRMRIRVDDVAIGIVDVEADRLRVERQSFRFPVALAGGEHTFAVNLANDAFDEATGADRNLFIEEVVISSRNGVYVRGLEGVDPLHTLYEPSADEGDLTVAAARYQAPDYPGVPLVTKVRLGNQTRNALFAPAPTDLRFEVDVPEGGRLSFGMATLPDSWHRDGDGVYFTVEVRDDDTTEVLFSRYIDPKRRHEDRRWIDGHVDLGDYAGDRIELWLRTAGTYPIDPPATRPSDATADFALWSTPRISVGRSNEPILILLSIDALRADHVGAYGYDRPTTPLLDRLADEGTIFESCYSQAPYTLPSHMSLLTGLLAFQHGVEDVAGAVLDPFVVTFPEFLRGQGFSTAAFTEGGLVKADYGFDHGFDRFRESGMFQDIHDGRPVPVGKGGRATLQEGLEWLSETARGSPTFLFLHTYQVHDPFNPPPETRELFPQASDGSYPPLLSLYDSEIRYFDEALGDFLDQLRERGLLDRVTLAIVSDHGIEMGERGNWLGHELRLYEENLRIPCVLWGRGIPRARVAPDTRLIDVIPTMLAALDLEPLETSLGHSVPLDGTAPDPTAYPNIGETGIVPDRPVRSYRVPRYTFILSENQKNGTVIRELYDRKYDPTESQNLAESEPDLVAILEGELREILASAPRARTLFEQKDLEALRALGYIR